MYINLKILTMLLVSTVIILTIFVSCDNMTVYKTDSENEFKSDNNEKEVELSNERGFTMYSEKAFKSIKIENEFIRLEINNKGKVISFTNRINNKNYLYKEENFVTAVKDGVIEFIVNGAYFEKEILNTNYTNSYDKGNIRFQLVNRKGDNTIELGMQVTVYPHYIVFEINEVTNADNNTEISFVNLNTIIAENVASTLNASYNEDFAVCVMALTLPVHCFPEIKGEFDYDSRKTIEHTFLKAKCYSEFGIVGNKAAVIACPFDSFLDVIQQVEKKEGLPCPILGGKWGKLSDDVKRSYLFIHDISEYNADEVIDYAKKMNAGMIMILGSAWRETDGHYRINKVNFPNGIDGLKNVVEKIHKAGMKAGLHFLPAEISQNDSYVSPVPDERLYKDGEAVLNSDIDTDTTTIEITEEISTLELLIGKTSAFPYTEPDPYEGRGMDILIGNEIIHYRIKKDSDEDREDKSKHKYILEECIRGAYGTVATPHKAGSKVYHLRRAYGQFLIDLNTSLLEEVSARVADIFNYCGFDMIYFDGSERLQPLPEDANKNHWYYNAKLQYAFYNKLERKENILVQGSSHSHFSWHMISRQASADGYSDVKRVLDSRSRSFDIWEKNFMPLDIGWYGIGASHITYDDIEYILCRSIGFNSSVGFSGSFANMKKNPDTPRIIEMISIYEKLRLENYFSNEVKAMLRKPGVDYKLIKDSNGRWIFIEKSI